jgi:3-oxoacyl-[acyl-carrier protein] reductase
MSEVVSTRPVQRRRLTTLSRSVAGQVALITGAASGMGRSTAHLFADEGAAVAVIDRTEEGVDAVVDEIIGAGGAAFGVVADLREPAGIGALVSQVANHLGPIDILVNNAGVSIPAQIDDESWGDAWRTTFAVNLDAHALLVRACLGDLARNGAGRIVNIASTEGLGATAFMSPYTAAKHAVIGLTRSLAVELGPRGITVNCVCPGPINTSMTAPIPDDAKTLFAKRRVPLRRYGEPEEVAHATLSLCLPASSFMNGVVFVVDGGMTIRNA